MDLVNFVGRQFEWLYDYYLWTFEFADKRVDGWPLMNSVAPTLTLIGMYYTMVTLGPKIMKDRKPFDLKWLMVFYNLFITFLNLHIFLELAFASARLRYSWFCQPITITDNPEQMRIVKALYLYYISKFIEFLDTLIFILRKKNNQLSFLHVYHHSTMFFFWWIGARYVPDGSAWLGPMVNSLIHVLMYSYYGLSALGPNIRKYLWWKQYLTILQLVQFTGGLILGINAILTGCTFTRWMQYLLVFYMLSFLVLFGNFYKNAYNHGLRAAYRMEMKKRALVLNSSKMSAVSNGHSNQANGDCNGPASSSTSENGSLRSRTKTSILTNNILTEELVKHSSG